MHFHEVRFNSNPSALYDDNSALTNVPYVELESQL